MTGLFSFEFDSTTLFVIIGSVLTLLVQILLCSKAKKLLVKFVPMMILTVSAIVFIVCEVCSDGWDAIGFLFLFLYSVWLLLLCGLGWGLWVLTRGKEKYMKILTVALEFLCWVIIFLCFADYLQLCYDYFATYQHLQSIHASGSEYLGLLDAPILFLRTSVVAVLAYGCYKKLKVNRFQIGGMVMAVFAAGLLFVIGIVVIQACY